MSIYIFILLQDEKIISSLFQCLFTKLTRNVHIRMLELHFKKNNIINNNTIYFFHVLNNFFKHIIGKNTLKYTKLLEFNRK